MKYLIYLLTSTILLSCTPNNPTPTPLPTTNGIDGDYQELLTSYCTYDCPTNSLTFETTGPSITPSGLPIEFIRLENGWVYHVISTLQTKIGSYNNEYITFSNNSDTAYITSQSSTEMIAETAAPNVPCSQYTTTKYIFKR
jgi:hypothetical protein